MNEAAPLSAADFAQVVRCTPLVSIDIVLKDGEDNLLVGLRTNEPAKGRYFVPGGVIRKNETLDCAFARILFAETGLRAQRKEAQLLGVYEHFYASNRFLEPGYGTHYVVLAYTLRFARRPVLQRDEQHANFKWMSRPEILAVGNVHENTKAYVR